MDTGTITAIGAAAVLIIAALVGGILQIISKLNELKTKTEKTADAVNGRMSAVEKAASEMMVAFKEQVLKAQAGEAAARVRQDEISATALADANERAKIAAVVIATAATVAATVVASAPRPATGEPGSVASSAAETAARAAETVEAAGQTVAEVQKTLAKSQDPEMEGEKT